ncbi:hypothetical protein TMatcc_005165 [Talaromyces marneffei ATCC 18224]
MTILSLLDHLPHGCTSTFNVPSVGVVPAEAVPGASIYFLAAIYASSILDQCDTYSETTGQSDPGIWEVL